MKRDFPLIISTTLLALGGFFLINPFEVWMPDMAHMTVLGVTVAAFGVLSLFIVHETSEDERDDAHRMLAGRAAFMAGSLVLLVGIVVQTLADNLDSWLVVALVSMVIAKLATRIWSRIYR